MNAPVDLSNLALGRKPGVVQDRRTLRLANYLNADAVLPKVPPSTRMGQGLNFDMLGNDHYGDCTYAAKVHLAHSVARSPSEPPAQAVIDAYLGFTHGVDSGAYELDVLNDWRTRDANDGAGRIEAYAAVRLADRALFHAACYIFGGLYSGAPLPEAAKAQIRAGVKWDVTGDPSLNWTPGSWGGHAMYVSGSFADGDVEFITWGRRQRASWRWVLDYVDELYAVIHPAWLARYQGKTPGGYNHDQLMADLGAVT